MTAIGEIVARNTDLGTFLVHLTRDTAEPGAVHWLRDTCSTGPDPKDGSWG